MKRYVSILLLLLTGIVSLHAQRTYVLIMGITNYGDEVNNLTQSTKDAKALADVLEHHTENITILTSKYVNNDNILEKLGNICDVAGKEDKILVFFSGHGYPGGIKIYDSMLSYKRLNNILSKSSAGATICFIDACHAGSVSEIKEQTNTYTTPASGNIIYMMSCRADEYSMERTLIGHSIFMQAVLKGLMGKADANDDKQLTVMELFNYVYNDVQHTAERNGYKQHPQLIGSKALVDAVIVDWK